MAQSATTIQEDRDLTTDELVLVQWLLEHGESDAPLYLPQLQQARVSSRCSCGCASIDFSVAGKRPSQPAMRVLSDFQWTSPEGHLFGAFVFAQDGLLGGLELWSIDGQSTPSTLPPTEALVPYGTPLQV
jgi:hypothetical protein